MRWPQMKLKNYRNKTHTMENKRTGILSVPVWGSSRCTGEV